MKVYPNIHLEKITEINTKMIKEKNIRAIIIDANNTITNHKIDISDQTTEWIKNMQKEKIKILILSNSPCKNEIKKKTQELEIPYIYWAKKPFKSGFKKAIKILQEKPENIAVIGDQIFTDVLGANRCKMFSILIEPVDKKEIVATKLIRPLEKIIIKKYKKKVGK